MIHRASDSPQTGPARPTVVLYGATRAVRWWSRRLADGTNVIRVADPLAASFEDVPESIAGPVIRFVDGGDDRVEHVAAMRAVSAVAGDGDPLLSASPVVSLEEIAESVTRPERLVGLVTAWPRRDRLVEVVITSSTERPTLDLAGSLAAAAVPEAPAVVERGGGPTLLVRCFGGLALAALDLVRRGADPDRVDDAARRRLGVAIGPLRLLDAFGLRRAAVLLGRADHLGDADAVRRSDGTLHPAWRAAPEAQAPDETRIERDLVDALDRAVEQAVAGGLVTARAEAEPVLRLGLGISAGARARIVSGPDPDPDPDPASAPAPPESPNTSRSSDLGPTGSATRCETSSRASTPSRPMPPAGGEAERLGSARITPEAVGGPHHGRQYR